VPHEELLDPVPLEPWPNKPTPPPPPPAPTDPPPPPPPPPAPVPALIYEIEGVTKKQSREFEKLFDRNIEVGIEYSIIDLFRFALNIPNKDEKHTFCSRYILSCCSKILEEDQMPLVRLKYKNWASPRDLRISPKLKLSHI
jgi:hypothetical protein